MNDIESRVLVVAQDSAQAHRWRTRQRLRRGQIVYAFTAASLDGLSLNRVVYLPGWQRRRDIKAIDGLVRSGVNDARFSWHADSRHCTESTMCMRCSGCGDSRCCASIIAEKRPGCRVCGGTGVALCDRPMGLHPDHGHGSAVEDPGELCTYCDQPTPLDGSSCQTCWRPVGNLADSKALFARDGTFNVGADGALSVADPNGEQQNG